MVLKNNQVFWEDHSCISPDVSHHPVAPVCEADAFLNDLANGNNYWIGGYPKDSTWVWSDFTSFDYDSDYNYSSGQCLLQASSRYGQGWSSVSCTSYEYYFICKQ